MCWWYSKSFAATSNETNRMDEGLVSFSCRCFLPDRARQLDAVVSLSQMDFVSTVIQSARPETLAHQLESAVMTRAGESTRNDISPNISSASIRSTVIHSSNSSRKSLTTSFRIVAIVACSGTRRITSRCARAVTTSRLPRMTEASAVKEKNSIHKSLRELGIGDIRFLASSRVDRSPGEYENPRN